MRTLLVLLFSFFCLLPVHASKIRVRDSLLMLNELHSKDPEDLLNAIQQITEYPNKYAPPVLYLLASVMFRQNFKKEAIFWLSVAQLRAQSDVAKCRNQKKAQHQIELLDEAFAPKINAYAFQHLQLFNQQVKKALRWDSQQKRYYDARWIILSEGKLARKHFSAKKLWPKSNTLARTRYAKAIKKLEG